MNSKYSRQILNEWWMICGPPWQPTLSCKPSSILINKINIFVVFAFYFILFATGCSSSSSKPIKMCIYPHRNVGFLPTKLSVNFRALRRIICPCRATIYTYIHIYTYVWLYGGSDGAEQSHKLFIVHFRRLHLSSCGMSAVGCRFFNDFLRCTRRTKGLNVSCMAFATRFIKMHVFFY